MRQLKPLLLTPITTMLQSSKSTATNFIWNWQLHLDDLEIVKICSNCLYLTNFVTDIFIKLMTAQTTLMSLICDGHSRTATRFYMDSCTTCRISYMILRKQNKWTFLLLLLDKIIDILDLFFPNWKKEKGKMILIWTIKK